VETTANWYSYNANPKHNRVGDCTVRAISKALEQDWERTYIELCLQGYMMCDMPSADHVWGKYLKSKGFKRGTLPDTCPDCYTVSEFCKEHPRGRYVVSIPGHVVAVVNGEYYDTWDSGNEVPTYFWYREE
jgi:hypothetical protein